MTAAVSNTHVEVDQHVQSPDADNPEPSESGPAVIARTDEPSPPTPPPSSLLDQNLDPIEDTAHPVVIGSNVIGGKAIGDGGTTSLYTNDPSDPSIPNDPHERAWQRLISCAVPQDELPSLIELIFSDKKTADMVDRLQGSDVQAFIDVIDEVLDSLTLTSRVRRNGVKSLYKTCARHSLLPRSLQITACYNPAAVPHSHGGFADVWKGEYDGLEVGVKVLRTSSMSDFEKITHAFCKEFVTWKALRHPNVLPLVGVMVTEDRFAMVSEWMTNGNINQFVKARPDANRFELLGDVARGLIYMHGQGMVHGDLKGANILVDQTCNARLADFGLLSVISDSTTSNSCTQGGTTRWMSPELLDPENRDRRQTTHSDCYALGMVMYEVLSGRVPLYQYPNFAIPGKVIGGSRPERPQEEKGVWFTDDVWEILSRCWTPQPANRPRIKDVLQGLEEASRSWVPPPQLLAAPSTTDSPTWGFSDIIAAESTDGNGAIPSSHVAPSQPLKPDQEGSVGIVNGVPPNHLGEHPSLQASNPSPEPGPLREAISGVDVGPNDVGPVDDKGDTLPPRTPRPDAGSMAGGSDGPVTDARSGSDVVARNTSFAAQPSQRENSDAASASMHNQDVVGMAGGVDEVSTLLAEHRLLTEDDAGGAWRTIRQGIQRPGVSPLVTLRLTYTSILLMEVANWDGKSQGIDQVLTALFDTEDYLDCIKNLRARNIDPQAYINSLDKIIDSLPADSDLRKRCIRALRKTCGLNGILPTSYVVPFTLSKPGRRPFASGGFSDVWRLTDEKNPDLVFAVKSLRQYEQDPFEKINMKYCKEVIVSKRMKHMNVLSIEGVAPKLFEFCMVSQWMPNRTMLECVAKHPEVNRLELLVGATRGLDYLHNNEVIHGDLTTTDVLIDEKGIPRLSDFGLSSITKDIDSVNASTPNPGCTVRYCAPEFLDIEGVITLEKKKPTYKSDVYSLSMVIVALVTGMMPFPEYTDPNVKNLISKGKRPQKPRRFEAPGMTLAVWKIAERCWHENAKERPEVNAVLQYLEGLANPATKDDKHARTPLLQRLREIFDG